MDRYVKYFSTPDEVIELETVRSEMVSRGGLTVSHDIHRPGWRWSVHVKPIVGTEWCQVHHVGVILGGRVGFRLQDGTEFSAGHMSVVDIPPGHDAWVEGDQPLEMVTWTGARGFLGPLESFHERVLTTLLFTDIVDSTATALRLGDRGWGDLLATHESRAREILARFRGRLVKTTGDGILASFDGAARALRCAVAMRDSAAELDIALRIAVHTGEVEVAGEDIRGVAVHEASRVLALAGAGEILVTDATAGLVRDAGIELEDRGEHELRGIPGARQLYAVA